MDQTVWRQDLLEKIDSYLEREWGGVDSQITQVLDSVELDPEGLDRVLDRAAIGGIPCLDLRDRLQKEPKTLRPGNEILKKVLDCVGGKRLLVIRGWGKAEPSLDPALALILGALVCNLGVFARTGGAVEIAPSGEGRLALSFFGPSQWGESWKGPEEGFGRFLVEALGGDLPGQEELESGDFRIELSLPEDAYATKAYPGT